MPLSSMVTSRGTHLLKTTFSPILTDCPCSREDFDLYARDEDLVARARGKFHIGNKLEHLNNGINAAAGAAELYRTVKGYVFLCLLQ